MIMVIYLMMSMRLILKIKSTTIHFRLMAWRNRYNQRKACKKQSKKLTPVVWHPTRW